MAFTLAETLVVIGIIGVVAALTLPNLNSSAGDKEKVAKVKKLYSNLSDALGRAQAVYGPIGTWCVNYSDSCSLRHINRITEFMNVSKVSKNWADCKSPNWNTTDGSLSGLNKCAILKDGTTLSLAIYSDGQNGYFLADIDGPLKGKNACGYDAFVFLYDRYSVRVNGPDDYVKPYGSVWNCETAAGWVVDYDNMDYLKTSDGTTCPNGTKLTVGGNHSCK